ncbi:MAG: hypothetical protein ABSG03_17645 [Bryobacteraceae bacterium]
MKPQIWLPALLILGGVWYFAVQRQTVYASQDLPPQTEGQQFRIIVGLKDIEARRWQGRIQVTGGEMVSLSGWRFSGQDRANADGTFAFETKMQPLEDQLQPGSYYGVTAMAGQAPRQVPEGLLVKVRGGGSARVSLESGSGNLEFSASDAAYGARVMLMDGNASVERLPMERRVSDPGRRTISPPPLSLPMAQAGRRGWHIATSRMP